jgi:fused signal recognition particle receptor
MFRKLKNKLKSWRSKKEEKDGEDKSKIDKIKSKFKFKINEEYFEGVFSNLELILLENNVALEVVEKIREKLKEELLGKEIRKKKVEDLINTKLKETLEKLLMPSFNLIEKIKKSEKPFKIILFGINGSGKTTTLAKLASLLKRNNLSAVLAASDTFRAASIEQLEKHSKNLDIELIKGEYGSDPASIAFDAVKHKK